MTGPRVMKTALEKISEGWRTGRLCESKGCLRDGPHFPGEYGCVESDVAVYVSDRNVGAVANWTAERLFG